MKKAQLISQHSIIRWFCLVVCQKDKQHVYQVLEKFLRLCLATPTQKNEILQF